MQISLNSYKPSVLFVRHMHTVQTLTKRHRKRRLIRSVFNNASAWSAIGCFLSERKRSPGCYKRSRFKSIGVLPKNQRWLPKQ